MAEWMARITLENWRNEDYESMRGLIVAETKEEALEKLLLREGYSIQRWENREGSALGSFPLWGQPEGSPLWTINWTEAKPLEQWLAEEREGQDALHRKWEEFRLVQATQGLNASTTD